MASIFRNTATGPRDVSLGLDSNILLHSISIYRATASFRKRDVDLELSISR